MRPKDYRDILAANINPDFNSGGGLAKKFKIWEGSLRNELVRLRAAGLDRNPGESTRDTENEASTAAAAALAMAQPNPLEVEIYLGRCRWEKIDEMSVGHFFDMEFLRAYRLKLQILERHAMFNEEKGFAVYKNICNQVMQTSEESA